MSVPVNAPPPVARPYTPIPGTELRYRGYSLCHGCSNGLHTKHVNVNCDCDLPGCTKDAA